MEGVFCERDEMGIPYLIEGEDGEKYCVKMNDIPLSFFEELRGKKKGWDLFFSSEKTNVCYILNFDVVEDSRLGKIAKNIVPTTHLVNNEIGDFDVIVTDLIFEHHQWSIYDNHPNYGAIARDYCSEVLLFYRKIGGYGKGVTDIRSQILKDNNRKKITDSLIERIKQKIVGEKLSVVRACPYQIQLGSVSDTVYNGNKKTHSLKQFLLNLDHIDRERNDTLIIHGDALIV